MAVALLILVLTFLLLYYALRTTANLRSLPRNLRGWRELKRRERARRYLTRGLLELAEGQWETAERSLVRFVSAGDTPLLNYLGAARAAQQRGDFGRRDYYLQQAHAATPESDVVVSLTQADLQLAQGQHEQALATATHLRRVAPRHGHVLKLLTELYGEVRDWERLRQLVPELRKQRVMEPAQLQQLSRQVHRERLLAAAHDREKLCAAWRATPREFQHQAELVAIYARQLMALGEGANAEALLYNSVQREWNEALVQLYGEAQGADPARQLARAEDWQPKHDQESALLLTLARLALRNQLWGKARIYLESSINLGADISAYRELGRLLEQMGESEAALACYRNGMELLDEEEHDTPPNSHVPLLAPRSG